MRWVVADGYQVKPKLPNTPGSEIAGVIEAVGEGVDSVGTGERVGNGQCGRGF